MPPQPPHPRIPGRLRLGADMIRFGVVGALGLLVDTAVIYSLRGWLGLYGAGAVSYIVAGTLNWVLHRHWTFRGRGTAGTHRQWALYLATNLLGFMLNRGAYAILIATVTLCRAYPVLAVAAGAVAGMGVNFLLTRQVVFAEPGAAQRREAARNLR